MYISSDISRVSRFHKKEEWLE